MKGHRRYPNADGSMPSMHEGDYGCFGGVWWGFAPGAFLGSFEAHEVVEHEDGTITVAPSIIASREDIIAQIDDAGPKFMPWHGYLERGVWHE